MDESLDDKVGSTAQERRPSDTPPGEPANATAEVPAGPAGRSGRGAPPRVVRIRDIAQVAGVAESTVSRVLNGAPSKVPFGAETRERVLTAARQLGYRPISPGPCASRRADPPARCHRPRFQRPVLRERPRGPRRGGNGARVQHRARACPRAGRRGAPADDDPRDAPLRCRDDAGRHAGPAAAARRPARLDHPGRCAVAGEQPPSSSRPSTSTTGPGSWPRCTT